MPIKKIEPTPENIKLLRNKVAAHMMKNTEEHLVLKDFWINVVAKWAEEEAKLPEIEIPETLEFIAYSGETSLAAYGAANNITMVYVNNIKKIQNGENT